MPLSRKLFKAVASSILEAVIALCVISICLIAMMTVYTFAFTYQTSVPSFIEENRLDESFFISQMQQPDQEFYDYAPFKIETTIISEDLTEISVSAPVHSRSSSKRVFYVLK